MMDSQDNKKSSSAPNKRRRSNHQRGSSAHDDDAGNGEDLISLYSDSSNDGENLSSNTSSPECTKMDNNNLTEPQNSIVQQGSGEKAHNEALPSKSYIHLKRGTANDDNNDNVTSEKEYYANYRTVQIPEGVTEGQFFHVRIKGIVANGSSSTDKVIGVKCPKGVKVGDTLIIVEPGSVPPLSPDQIAKINEQRLVESIDKEFAKWVVISFWKIVWPLLVDDGWWCKRESLYNFGSVTFYSPTAKQMSSDQHYKLNQDYFESISAVLDYIKLFPMRKSLVDMCFVDAEKRKSADAKANSTQRKRSYAALDRWKYPTGMEALKHSRVGSNYQVHSLPKVGTFSKDSDDDNGCILEPITGEILKEQDSIKATWREWAKDDAFANEFHHKILAAKKQFRILAVSMNKPIGFCLWYYYCKYKTSDNYVILKNLLQDNNESGEHLDDCVICNDGGGESDLVIISLLHQLFRCVYNNFFVRPPYRPYLL